MITIYLIMEFEGKKKTNFGEICVLISSIELEGVDQQKKKGGDAGCGACFFFFPAISFVNDLVVNIAFKITGMPV